MNTQNLENNLFKAILVGVFLMGVSIIVPTNSQSFAMKEANAATINNVQKPRPVTALEAPMPRVIIVGKRLSKKEHLLAAQ